MLRIIACFKWVVDDADIKMDAASRKLIFDRVGFKISEYDRNAIEEATRVREQYGGTVAAVTVAPPSAKQCLKDVLSRGPDTAWFINDSSFSDLEPSQTASILAETLKSKIEYDLIICGEGSGDIYAQQVGPALAENLGIPCATCVNKLTYVESENRLIAERRLEETIETVSIPLPALVAVLPDINLPRIPTLKQVLGAAKKPFQNVSLEDLGKAPGAHLETKDILAATMDRRRLMFPADSDGIRSVVDALIREGIIS
jgi:electron transfer flavoprotein beta subunit